MRLFIVEHRQYMNYYIKFYGEVEINLCNSIGFMEIVNMLFQDFKG